MRICLQIKEFINKGPRLLSNMHVTELDLATRNVFHLSWQPKFWPRFYQWRNNLSIKYSLNCARSFFILIYSNYFLWVWVVIGDYLISIICGWFVTRGRNRIKSRSTINHFEWKLRRPKLSSGVIRKSTYIHVSGSCEIKR